MAIYNSINDIFGFNINQIGNNGNAAQINSNDYYQELASTRAIETPELLENILRFLPSTSLLSCSSVSHQWRMSAHRVIKTYKEFMAMEIERYEARPKHINIHILKSIVLQYSAEDHKTHSKPKTYQFVFSCQTQAGSTDSFGGSIDRSGSSTEAHQHHTHHSGQEKVDDSPMHLSGYRSSAIISNVYFKVAPSSTSASGGVYVPPQSQASSSSYPASEGIRFDHLSLNPSQFDTQTTASDSQSTILKIIPCPYEPTSDSSFSNEDSPPPGERNSRSSGDVKAEPFDASISFQGGSSSGAASADLYSHNSLEGYRYQLSEHSGHGKEKASEYQRSQNEEHQMMDFTEPMDSDSPNSTHRQQQHHPRQHQSSARKRPSTSSGSTGKKRRLRPSRNWSMGVQAYFYQNAAVNAMVLAAKNYMESTEGEECRLVEKTETTRIIWNDSTMQELIWIITPTNMDRTNPGDFIECDYDPSWQE
ncbi:hypothetical protein BGX27_007831 [Mortierella sp. AM989]|nr:hypothetical protein BGX27_007831 [Mortierella sp. AM989]